MKFGIVVSFVLGYKKVYGLNFYDAFDENLVRVI